VAALTTTIGADAADKVVPALDDFWKEIGGTSAVTGATLIAVAVGLKAAAHFSKAFGDRYRAFLRSWGLRP
jgi:GH15 family glucan-1,4-alpha-glucosidase